MKYILPSGDALWAPLPQKEGDVDSEEDSFAALRWRAAKALLDSVEPKQKQWLEEEYGQAPKQKEEEEDEEEEEEDGVSKPSVGELVAAARLEEAKLQKAKWAKERKKLLKEAEAASRERVENALSVRKERDEYDEHAHPLLGEPLLDMGYKRVHVVSSKVLSSIPIWEKLVIVETSSSSLKIL
jgi:hypothetical protein